MPYRVLPGLRCTGGTWPSLHGSMRASLPALQPGPKQQQHKQCSLAEAFFNSKGAAAARLSISLAGAPLFVEYDSSNGGSMLWMERSRVLGGLAWDRQQHCLMLLRACL